MKENEHVAKTWDITRDIQIFSLTLSQLSYFDLLVVNFHVEIALFTENANTNKKWQLNFGTNS